MSQGEHHATKSLENPFWRYSLTQYAQPGCAAFLISAQDEHNLDVNILLFLSWLSKQRKILTNKQQLQSVELFSVFQVSPIRRIRRICKHIPVTGLYDTLKGYELKLEQHQQARLFRKANKMDQQALTSVQCWQTNIGIYLGELERYDESWLQALNEHLQP